VVEIIGRARWGAQHRAGSAAAPLPASEVWLHHSTTTAPSANASFELDAVAVCLLEQIGQSRFGAGISYSFIVLPSGRVFEGHGIDRRGTHTAGRNSTSRAICLLGNYETTDPTPAQHDAVAELLAHGQRAGWWTHPRLAGGHCDVKATACPGERAYRLIPEINRRAAGRPTSPAPQEDDDMPLNSQDLAAITDIIRREVASAVWNAQVPDFYQPADPKTGHPSMPAFAALGYATSHAARAANAAHDAADGVDKLLLRPAGQGPDPAKRYRLVSDDDS
jgi:N-acetylmuramoyl-L-alanine amidase